MGGACHRCGYSHQAGLTLHHRDPSRKTRRFSGGGWTARSIDAAFVEELATCQLLCMNCHAEIHWHEREEADYAATLETAEALPFGAGEGDA